jgi:hypothetical protein
MAAAMALLASTTVTNATDAQPNSVPSPATAKRQNEDEHTPVLILAPASHLDTLIADHSSHASHSSHYSSASDPTPDTPPAPTTPYVPPSSVAPSTPTPAPPPVAAPPATQLDQSVLNKLAVLPDFWPKKVTLNQPFSFTVIHDGIATGHLDAPAGTIVDLVAVKGIKLVVSLLDNKAEVSASITDIGDRINVQAIVAAPMPTPPSSTNAPPVAPVSPATSPTPSPP